jgi:phenylpropionate dioxygenase-like ring-hydroxylating dioxygenase large terminal subunit
MTTAAEGAELTRVGPGTVMGGLMRQYWIPAAMSSELRRDGAPLRLMLLGERLIAFRDSAGRVGVMDHRCPHRCASLFLGRNEAGGLRCIYHGWKFDVSGNCIDMPSVPSQQDFKAKVKAKAYRATERAGVVWVYMGAAAEAPPFPQFEAALLPEDELTVVCAQRSCNYLQALEGDIDTSHFGFLHGGHVDATELAEDNLLRYTVQNRTPEYFVAESDWGTTYAAHRQAGDGRTYWRFANFLFPFWTQTPQGEFPHQVDIRAWVPMDDTHTMFVHLSWTGRKRAIGTVKKDGSLLSGFGFGHRHRPNTTDWHGRWRLEDDEANDWAIDRIAQEANTSYSGIENIHMQDQAVTESMGAITDHAFEHLAPSDQMVARTRRRLLMAARALRDDGTLPPGIEHPEVFYGSRGGFFFTAPRNDWRELYAEQLRAAVRPAEKKQAAE